MRSAKVVLPKLLDLRRDDRGWYDDYDYAENGRRLLRFVKRRLGLAEKRPWVEGELELDQRAASWEWSSRLGQREEV